MLAHAAIASISLCVAACHATSTRERACIAVLATISHPTADACIEGFVAGWKDETGAEPRIEKHCGNGDAASLRSAMDAARRTQPDLVLALGSAAVREACEQGGTQTIVGAWCFDLNAACGDAPRNLLWGVETPPPTRQQAELLASVKPKPSRIGVVYAPTEAIAVRQVAATRAMLADSGIELVEQHITEPSQVDGLEDTVRKLRLLADASHRRRRSTACARSHSGRIPRLQSSRRTRGTPRAMRTRREA